MGGHLYSLTSKRLNDYVKLYLGPDFTAKDFRTWGGTLLAAVALRRAGKAARVSGDEDGREALGRCRDAARGDSSSGIRPPFAGRHTSRPRSSTSISRGERSRISVPAICVWSAPANSGSMRGAGAAQPASLLADSAGARRGLGLPAQSGSSPPRMRSGLPGPSTRTISNVLRGPGKRTLDESGDHSSVW